MTVNDLLLAAPGENGQHLKVFRENLKVSRVFIHALAPHQVFKTSEFYIAKFTFDKNWRVEFAISMCLPCRELNR